MRPSFRSISLVAALFAPVFGESATSRAAEPTWIWNSADSNREETVYFRKEFEIPGFTSGMRLFATCDNTMTVFIDGKEVAKSDDWSAPIFRDVTDAIDRQRPPVAASKHVIAVKATNQGGPAGLVLRLVVEGRGRRGGGPGGFEVVSDGSWLASNKPAANWNRVDFASAAWPKAVAVAKLGAAPWPAINEAAFRAAMRIKDPGATPVDQLKVAKGFKVELLYSVPKDKEGSWVNMCVDPKGRLIVCDQYGGLYRVTPPALGGNAEDTKIERIPADIGEAQGLLWAFDSLYVVVNQGGKYKSGLYRVTDSDGDDMLDKVETLRQLQGGGEHGPHAVMLTPDGKSLVIVCGNGTKMTDLADSRVPRVWSEDHILPRMPDGNGFMRDVLAPGGCIYRVDPDGKSWELLSMGYRNEFDAAFNKNGDLLTYDADMEWDMNTPWYRPTRVCLATSGSEFGWRNGAGKWPTYYPDGLPAVVNIGPGSPTGVCFGYGAKFPAKYQDAFFICDWSYGKLYAIHTTPEGSAYKGEIEEFVTGAPLPLTDVVVNPADRALYFAIGGRRTKSGLYRVTYVGAESTEAAGPDELGKAERALRRKLESYHYPKGVEAVDAAWPHLGHADRFIRFAARVALEHQDPSLWQDRALAEKDPAASLTALLALSRVGKPAVQAKLLESLDRISWESLSDSQRIDLLRVQGLAFMRLGKPDDATRSRTIAKFDPKFPSRNRELNAELCKMLIYLEAPSAAAKSIALLVSAPSQEEQLEYGVSLRNLRKGWTIDQRKAYFSWLLKAANFKGGNSMGGFLRNIRTDALATLTDSEKSELKGLLETKPTIAPAVAAANRPFKKEWKLDELTALLETGLKDRDFDRGRSMFGAASCFACHRFANEGGAFGPDLTGVVGRFSRRDLLESVVEPSKTVSDQYQAVILETSDGRVVTGRIVNLNSDSMMVNTNMLDPNGMVNVDRKLVESTRPSPISMMPQGLLNTLDKDEVLDLVAYLFSGGDPKNAMFKQPSK